MLKCAIKLLYFIPFVPVVYGSSDRPENDESKSTEAINLWKKMANSSCPYINFDEFDDNFFEIVEMDTKDEFSFILFIFVSRGERNFNYEYICEQINHQIKNFVNLKDQKTGYKVLVVLVPIDHQTDWKEHGLSSIVNIPNVYPTFALVCKQKQCKVCGNQKSMTLISLFYGMYFPQAKWTQDLLHKATATGKPLKKSKFPYNQVGIITTILAHNFEKKENWNRRQNHK